MTPLKINDIKEWLTDNRSEYQALKAQEFPPLDNEVYWMYNNLQEFIDYFAYAHKCNKVLQDLKPLIKDNFSEIIKWTQVNEVLGSQQLLMFEVNYIDWTENVDEAVLKIHERLYVERKLLAEIICFCKIFRLLYWNNDIHYKNLTQKEQLIISTDLHKIFNKYYFDTALD